MARRVRITAFCPSFSYLEKSGTKDKKSTTGRCQILPIVDTRKWNRSNSSGHKGNELSHEMHDVGNLVQKCIAPAISNKSCHPCKPEKVT